MAISEDIPEIKRLVAILQARSELLPLKALFLKGALLLAGGFWLGRNW